MFIQIKQIIFVVLLSFVFQNVIAQDEMVKTYINPVIPGDHPDPTLTQVGKDFYTSGSSFNPTPKIYHSTDLVHWEVVSQPVSASWSRYGNTPGAGIWGGHMVFYNGMYWHFFGGGGINGNMYFVKAEQPEGPWSEPEVMNVPSGLSSQGIHLGVDNSIFIDDDNKWYLLTKAGQSNNHIVELGDDGQPNGNIIDLTWLNPESEGLPYGWAEGPVMWKYKGYYYYSFAQHLVGSQYVMRSDTLSDEESEWTIIGTNIFTGAASKFYAPNHISPAVMLEDSTSWVVVHSYHENFKAQGRQGLLCQVIYDNNGFPKILRPQLEETTAPNLPSSGIPWMVPHSDNFDSEKMNPEWSFLGYTPESSYSLTEKPGWLKLSPRSNGTNTIIKNDGEHSYSLITKIDFEPESQSDEAGLWVINGPETHLVKVASTMNFEDKKVFAFSFQNNIDEPGNTLYEVENTLDTTIVWLKLIRNEHYMSGYFSPDGISWTQIGSEILSTEIDVDQTDYNDFTGNQQGLFTKGKTAYFDLYIYRDGYTPISASNPTNRYQVMSVTNMYPPNNLGLIHNDDWAMYAGVEFGNEDYQKQADSISFDATCGSSGGVVEVFLDSLTGTKIAEVNITNTGGNYSYKTFTGNITTDISGNHDLYLKFIGSARSEIFRIRTITLIDKDLTTSVESIQKNRIHEEISMDVFYSTTQNNNIEIRYSIPENDKVSLKIFDLNGKEIAGIFEGSLQSGDYESTFNTQGLRNGVYLCTLKAGNYSITKKILTIK